MLGPPAFAFRLPLTARIASRTSSAESRRIANRQNQRLPGSFASPSGVARDDMR